MQIYVGSGPLKVRSLFEKARENAPSIIFIDEIESIGLKRHDNFDAYTNNVERYSTLNQLLSEMDGVFKDNNIIVIGATNREDLLDPALLREGRFDYKIELELPNKEMRKQLFNLYCNKLCKNVKYNKDQINEFYLIDKTEGASCATIESIFNEIATSSMHKKANEMSKEDIDNIIKTKLENQKYFKY